MDEKLTIIVTCTDGKTVTPEPHLRVRDLPVGSCAERAGEWLARVRDAAPVAELRQLYKGDQWQRSMSLLAVAAGCGFKVQLLVASAGLGLRAADERAPSYAATFARGRADSVARAESGSADWWQQLHEGGSPVAQLQGRVLLVLSDSYARALASDICDLAVSGGEVALVGGRVDVAGVIRIPSDAGLRAALGGATSSLNPRMAAQFLRCAGQPRNWLDTGHLRAWSDWVAANIKVERFSRTPASDAVISDWVFETRRADAKISATRALRLFRDSGLACEQARFAQLFRAANTGRTHD